MDNETQLKLFADAVAALGGQQATSRALNMSDRSVRMLLAGDRRLHVGILEDMAKALINHADHCRMLERKLSPAFAGNLSEAQRRPALHGGTGKPSLAKEMHRTLVKATDDRRIASGWTISHTTYAKLADDSHADWGCADPETLFGLPFDVAKDDDLSATGYTLHVQEA